MFVHQLVVPLVLHTLLQHHAQVVQYIKDGHVLECPENTPKSVYKLMTMCWSSSPNNRPCFRYPQCFISKANIPKF